MHTRSYALTLWTLGIALTASEASAQAADVVASQSPVASIAAESAKVAPPPSAPAPTFLSDILVNAFASFGYTYNMNTPSSRLNSYRVFDSDDNTFNVDVAELVLQKPVAKAGDAGFRLDFEVGGAIPQKEQSYGLSVGQSADLQQAFLSYVAPLGSGMRLDFGKFVTHMGSEVIEGYDGYNDNYTRSFLFNYAIPLTHTGIKASYAVNGALSGMLMLVNGWDNAKDNNRSKTLGAQIVLTPVSPVTLYFCYLGGPEKADTNGYARNTYDVIANWRVLKTLTLGVNGDYGVEKSASLTDPGANAVWKGLAGYARVDVTSKLILAFRGETFHDEGGTRLGVTSPATLGEFTFTPTYKVGDRFIVRSDLRFDHANTPLFAKNGGLSDKQTTVSTNIIFVY